MSDDIFHRFRSRGDAAAKLKSPGDESTAGFHRLREAELLAAVDRLPAMPAVVQQLLGQMGSEVTGAGDMENLISQDMVITGRLLKLVNSPFYSLPNPVASIQQAVALIGLRSLRSLVVAVTAADLLNLDLSMYGFARKGLWINSMVTAALARRVAEQVGLERDACDEAFVAGLLRDVGMLVLGPFIAESGLTLTQAAAMRKDKRDPDILDRERKTIRFDHCWAGERVAEKWNLPPNLRKVISRHHRIPKDLDKNGLRLFGVIRLAERLAYNAGAGLLIEHPFDTAIDGTLLRIVGLDAERFKTIMAEVPSIIDSAVNDVHSA